MGNEAGKTYTVTDHYYDGKRHHVFGTIAIAASPGEYRTGGLQLSWAGVTGAKGPHTDLPSFVSLSSRDGNPCSWVAASNKMKIFSAEATEISQAAIPAGVSGDLFNFHAVFRGL